MASVPPSVQVQRLDLYPHSYVITNEKHGNNRRVIRYGTMINGVRVERRYANDFVQAAKTVRRTPSPFVDPA